MSVLTSRKRASQVRDTQLVLQVILVSAPYFLGYFGLLLNGVCHLSQMQEFPSASFLKFRPQNCSYWIQRRFVVCWYFAVPKWCRGIGICKSTNNFCGYPRGYLVFTGQKKKAETTFFLVISAFYEPFWTFCWCRRGESNSYSLARTRP